MFCRWYRLCVYSTRACASVCVSAILYWKPKTSFLRSLSTGLSAAVGQDWEVRNVRSKGKEKRDRRWKRAIRLATVEWVLSIAFWHCREALSAFWLQWPSPSSRAVTATIRHFGERHQEFCFVHYHKACSPPPGKHINVWVWLHIWLNCNSVKFEDKYAGLIIINLLSFQNGLPLGSKLRLL